MEAAAAGVYEMPEEAPDKLGSDHDRLGRTLLDVHVVRSNCIQCGTITAKGARLTPAEGGDGPNCQVM